MPKNLKIFYNLISPPSRSVLITASKLNLNLDKQLVNLMKNEHLTDEYTKINPAQNIPVVIDNGLTLKESRSIMTYLVQKYSPNNTLYPSNDLLKRHKIDEVLYLDAGHIFGCYGPLLHFAILERKEPNDILISYVEKNLSKLENIIKNSGHKFLAGNQLTLGDISVITSITSLQKTGLFDFNSKPKILEWINNVKLELDNTIYDEYIEQGGEAFKKLIFKLIKKA